MFKDVEPEDLIKFGLIPELVGRLPVVATLGELTEEAMVQILTEPKNALVKQYQKLFSMDGVDLEIRPRRCQGDRPQGPGKRKTGARGLRSIVEQSLDRHDVRTAHACRRGQGRGGRTHDRRKQARRCWSTDEQAKASA